MNKMAYKPNGEKILTQNRSTIAVIGISSTMNDASPVVQVIFVHSTNVAIFNSMTTLFNPAYITYMFHMCP